MDQLVKISKFYRKYNWLIVLVICVIIFLICAILNWWSGDQGSWSEIIYTSHNPYLYTPKYKHTSKCRNKYEKECRRIIEQIYKQPFPSMRPYFLRNHTTGKNLELDMYNPYLNLAIEYDGIQHRKYTPFYHKSHDDFISQQSRDLLKRKLCKEYNLDLIKIPDTVKWDDLESYIRRELRKINRL